MSGMVTVAVMVSDIASTIVIVIVIVILLSWLWLLPLWIVCRYCYR